MKFDWNNFADSLTFHPTPSSGPRLRLRTFSGASENIVNIIPYVEVLRTVYMYIARYVHDVIIASCVDMQFVGTEPKSSFYLSFCFCLGYLKIFFPVSKMNIYL